MSVWAIVVAAGSGSRFGGPKQYEPLGGRRVLDWAVEGVRTVADGVVLAVPADRAKDPEDAVDVVVVGGATRSESVRAALAEVPADAEVVIVHDAARPLAPIPLFAAVVTAVRTAGVDGAVPGVAVADTIKHVSRGRVVSTLDRNELVAVQTPQAFRAAVLRRAHASRGDATDDAALIEAIGGTVVVVTGDPRNAKLTDAADLARAQAQVGRAPSS